MGGVGKGLDYLVQKIERGEWNKNHIYHHFCKFLQLGFQGEVRTVSRLSFMPDNKRSTDGQFL